MVRLREAENEPNFMRLSRAIGLGCVAAIIVLSLLPGDERPHTGLAGQIEHTLAYFGTALFLGLAFRTTRDRVAAFSLLVVLAAVLEVIQRLIPGRHSQTIDWIASSFGAGIGIIAVIALERLLTPPPLRGAGGKRLKAGHSQEGTSQKADEVDRRGRRASGGQG
jgi:hypothetical protein